MNFNEKGSGDMEWTAKCYGLNDGQMLLQLDTCWILTVLVKVAKKA